MDRRENLPVFVHQVSNLTGSRRESALATITTITDEARIAFDNLLDAMVGGGTPTVRLGVTGLSRAGKTVFIAALVHNLVHGGRLPLFDAHAGGRLAAAHLVPQPDDAVPRFAYEAHVRDLVDRARLRSFCRKIDTDLDGAQELEGDTWTNSAFSARL